MLRSRWPALLAMPLAEPVRDASVTVALILFDLNGTLLDPGAEGERIQAAVRLGMIHTMAGEFRPLRELLDAVGGVMPAVMPPFPDVEAGLRQLEAQGHRLAVLTNSPRETAEQRLARAGLRELFERVIGVDEIGAYKPDVRTYRYALEQLRAAPRESWMVAAHGWDLIGARGAGMRTAFVSRGDSPPATITVERIVEDLGGLSLACGS